MIQTVVLIGFIIVFLLVGIIRAVIEEDPKEKLLREIRDELRKKNKHDEVKEGKIFR